MAAKRKVSLRLTFSYVLDWLVIVVIAAIGGGLNFVTPYHRPFSLVNLDISYPYVPELISTTTLALVSLIAPAIIIALVVGLLVPGPAFIRRSTRAQIIKLKLWEFEKGWAGLALSVATAFCITQGMKNLFGKPRPDFLARCQPDLANVAAHVIGGYGQDISARWTLVDSSICTQTDLSLLNDGFRSFPSGHSSFSWSGLLYLTLFLCSKFSIAIPYLPIQPSGPRAVSPQTQGHGALLPLHEQRGGSEDEHKTDDTSAAERDNVRPVDIRGLAATPPNHLVVLAFVPIGVAIYICSTRYAQFYHHGFDVISGALIGILTASFSFRWYHLPLSRGQGWAYGPRSADRAFGVGVGTRGFVSEGIANSPRAQSGSTV
ncbi:hypothetical protein LTR86_005640 [Recurvomyces mirabilis]|nr:hypothetical protein LTR86_005640 [Recurvomyces mirabilis]